MTKENLKIGAAVNTPMGLGKICDYTDRKVRVGGWDGHNAQERTYYVVLDGDTHHRPFREDQIFVTVEESRLREDITQRLRSWQGTSCVNKLLWYDIEEAVNYIAQLRAALEMFYDPDDRTDRGQVVRDALGRYDTKYKR